MSLNEYEMMTTMVMTMTMLTCSDLSEYLKMCSGFIGIMNIMCLFFIVWFKSLSHLL